MVRFDDLTREEKYYSATILPYLLAYDNFMGLITLEKELKLRGYITELSGINNSIQLLSEVYIERDLPYYKIEIPAQAFSKKMKKQCKPDLLVLTDHSLLLFECKVFNRESEYELYQQILRQKYIIDIIECTSGYNFKNKLHLLVLPYEYNISDCIVITWSQIYMALEKIIPKADYFYQRLYSLISRI